MIDFKSLYRTIKKNRMQQFTGVTHKTQGNEKSLPLINDFFYVFMG